MAQKQLVIICGEASGDVNAGSLAQAIKKIDPHIKISGVGGPHLSGSADDIYYDIKSLSVIGFFDVIKKLPRFFALKELVLQKLKKDKPDAIIFVDFSGFNLRLAQAINKTLPTIYYTSPQLWASRPGRIKTIKKYIDKMFVLFKFEEEFYRKRGVDAVFTGHPLLDIVKPTMDKKPFLHSLKFSEDKTTIALLPGSRKAEIEKILPIMLNASLLINRQTPAQFVIAKSTQVHWDIYNRILKKYNLELKVVEGKTYDCLNAAGFAMVASGTATLEAAIMQKPFVVIYKMNVLNYLLYRPQVRMPYIGMVNIVTGKQIVPEYIQWKAKPKAIAGKILELLKDPARLGEMKSNLQQVKSSLGEKGASLRAAELILKEI